MIGHTLTTTTKGQREAQGGTQPFFPLGNLDALRFGLHTVADWMHLDGEACTQLMVHGYFDLLYHP